MIEHREAVITRLKAHQYLTVHSGPVPDGVDPPYVVVYVYVPDERRTKLEGATDESTITIVTHSVAHNDEGAGIIARNVRQQLLDHRMAVAGWMCGRISHELGRSPDRQTVAGIDVLDVIDEWDYRAEPL